jgi:hypothetical protein
MFGPDKTDFSAKTIGLFQANRKNTVTVKHTGCNNTPIKPKQLLIL